jgi:hypothetical protein
MLPDEGREFESLLLQFFVKYLSFENSNYSTNKMQNSQTGVSTNVPEGRIGWHNHQNTFNNDVKYLNNNYYHHYTVYISKFLYFGKISYMKCLVKIIILRIKSTYENSTIFTTFMVSTNILIIFS